MISWNMRTEGLELKDGSTIKNYHYEFNSTDKVIAKIVEDVFKAIMDISAGRKTEPIDKDINVRSKDEPQTDRDTCLYKDAYDEWEGNCDTCENGSEYTPLRCGEREGK